MSFQHAVVDVEPPEHRGDGQISIDYPAPPPSTTGLQPTNGDGIEGEYVNIPGLNGNAFAKNKRDRNDSADYDRQTRQEQSRQMQILFSQYSLPSQSYEDWEDLRPPPDTLELFAHLSCGSMRAVIDKSVENNFISEEKALELPGNTPSTARESWLYANDWTIPMPSHHIVLPTPNDSPPQTKAIHILGRVKLTYKEIGYGAHRRDYFWVARGLLYDVIIGHNRERFVRLNRMEVLKAGGGHDKRPYSESDWKWNDEHSRYYIEVYNFPGHVIQVKWHWDTTLPKPQGFAMAGRTVFQY
ncbi:hypothetical protein K458DRAFT_429604 [Lentithecium fluviatile CBS 122367]|uniref:Uncharacterized protein n=1 Tax=Lentithecium fluviatile CBS 122367 TaxID=1168545 RepID=A0A6G1J7W6_9PLEO|nr:hypothetical protein K458DRAFT_429604 [Lentithecium fluviatile CBS 122367]